jgi:hypothetical protein
VQFENADLIHAHTRADSLRDGVLIHTLRTRADALPDALRAARALCQEEAGRLRDVLTMLAFAIRGGNGGAREVRFSVRVRNDNRDRTPPLVRLKAVCGPGDNGEPVITVMTPTED